MNIMQTKLEDVLMVTIGTPSWRSINNKDFGNMDTILILSKAISPYVLIQEPFKVCIIS